MPHNIKLSSTIMLLKSDPQLLITASWFHSEFWESQKALTGTGRGRGAVWFIQSTFGNFVLRRYRRGGLMAKINTRHFLFTGIKNTRPWLELQLLEKMHALKLPVPRPIGGLVTLTKGFYQAELLTETIPNANDLFDLIKDGNHSIDWSNIGHVIKQFHHNKVYHSDLNCHNIMIDKDDKVWVIDFDKCAFKDTHTDWQTSNIDRLKRSLDKESNRHSTFHVSNKQWQAFLEGYNNG